MDLLIYIAVTLVATLVTWKGSSLLESSSAKLASFYRLPPVVQGTIITAIGSSFPELSSTVLSTLLHGRFELGIATVVGSAMFNILVIPALSVLFGGKLSSDKILVYKDAQFYITSVAVLLLAFSFAIIYEPVSNETYKGYFTRTIAIIPLLLYLLYLFIQQQDTREHQLDTEKSEEDSDISASKQWGVLAVSLLLIVGGAEGLVWSAIQFGEYFNTPDFLWGLTVVAVATSIPDAIISINTARADKSMVSLANVLGSNIFDLLVAIPIGVLLAGATTINFAVAAPMMGFLTIGTIILFTTLRTDLELTLRECWILLGTYGLFLTLMIMQTFGVVEVL